MHTIETHTLHGICLRLAHAIQAERDEAHILASWIVDHPHVFGNLSHVRPAGRHRPGVDPQDWKALGDHLAAQLQRAAEPYDQPLDRLQTIAVHLGLGFCETSILRFLLLQQRAGPIAEFASMLKRQIGISDEAVIAWCCNLDESEVWNALAPQGGLVTLGLVQSDSTLAVMRDDPYTLSGLLLALVQPPQVDDAAGLIRFQGDAATRY